MRKLNRIFKSQKASTLLPVLILGLIIGVLIYAISSQQLLGLKKNRYYRIVQARDLIVENLERELNNFEVFINSLVQVPAEFEFSDGHNRFLNCVFIAESFGGRPEPNCLIGESEQNKTLYPFYLFASYPLNERPTRTMDDIPTVYEVSGKSRLIVNTDYNLDAMPCNTSIVENLDLCPFYVSAKFSAECYGGALCEKANSIQIHYSVELKSESGILKFFKIKKISKEHPLPSYFLKNIWVR